MTEQEAKFQVSSLHGGFGDNEVLHDINMDIPALVVTAIIGPSGCGKSTLIRCLNRMHERVPSAFVNGSIKINSCSNCKRVLV